MAVLSADGRDDEAAAEADRAFAEWQERQQLERQQGVALLEAGLRADLLRRDAPSAARRILQRIEIGTDAGVSFDALRREQDDWYARGRDKGLNLDLEVSIALARLSVVRAQDRSQRAAALNDLGAALRTLGERETGAARLEEAVATYHSALEQSSRDRSPLEWAATQNNLGNALSALGARESCTARLEEAVAAYRAALEERTRDRSPLDWAMTQNNLGNALLTIGVRESSSAQLEQAVVAFRSALEVYAHDRTPREWAMAQHNLGNALTKLGERESGTERLELALEAYRAALTEHTRDRAPLDWAGTQSNRGNALQRWARARAARRGWKRPSKPTTRRWRKNARPRALGLGGTQNNLGNALTGLGVLERSTARLEEAVDAYRAALEERTRDRVPLDWAASTGKQGMALFSLADLRSDLDLGAPGPRPDRGCGVGDAGRGPCAQRRQLPDGARRSRSADRPPFGPAVTQNAFILKVFL